MRRVALLWALLPAAAAGCSIKVGEPGPHVERLLANPSDTHAMAELAILGERSPLPLLKALEAYPNRPELRRAALATLAVAGEPCGPKMVEYLDMGANDSVKEDVLEVFARGAWKSVVRKLAERVAEARHPALSQRIYWTLRQILEGETIPESPWVEGELDPVRISEWNRWMGQHAKTLVRLPGSGSKFGRHEIDDVRARIEEELKGW